MELNQELESKNALPNEDDYRKAIDLIVRYCCKGRWATIAQKFSFTELDLNGDGSLTSEEIRAAIKKILGEEPSNALVDNMLNAIDDDADGSIAEHEFNNILAQRGR